IFLNKNGYIYRIDRPAASNPVAQFVDRSFESGKNDGASCSSNPILLHRITQNSQAVSEENIPVQIDSIVTHHYQMSNGLAPGTIEGEEFVLGLQDMLEDGRYFVADSLTITGAEDNSWQVNDYGTGALLEINNINIEPLGSVEISIDVYIPKLDSGTIYNTAYLTGVVGSLGGQNGKVPSDHPGGTNPDPTPLNVENNLLNNSITGVVYWDQNQNQIKDENELIIPNAKVTLNNVDQTLSNELGEYEFKFLSNQAYEISSAQVPYFSQSDNAMLAVQNFDESFVVELNIPMKSVSSITGIAFVDINFNGKLDEGETRLANVLMVFDQGNGQDGIVVLTDENGYYEYPVIEGDYQLNVPMLSEYSLDKFTDLPITIFPGSKATVNWPIELKGIDTDGDNVPDRIDLDDDNDGILDVDENAYGNGDFDGDGIVNRLDSDSDNDGIFDLIEVGLGQYDVDGDGRIDIDDILTSDNNNNGIMDVIETSSDQSIVVLSTHQCDEDNLPNPYDLDSDNDGLPDIYESALRTEQDTNNKALILALGLSMLDPDGNGVVDSAGSEDLNNNGVVDLVEHLLSMYQVVLVDSDFDGIADYCDTDSDGDGIYDLHEVVPAQLVEQFDHDFDGVVSDSNGFVDANLNGIDDIIDNASPNPSVMSQVDDNNNDIADVLEAYLHLIQINNVDQNSDFDRDGYSDLVEIRFGGNPLNGADYDVDSDGIPDWVEHTDLIGDSSNDSDNDEFSDLLESVIDTNPITENFIDELYDAAYEHILNVNRYQNRSAKPVIWIDLYDNDQPVLHFTRQSTQARFSVKQGNFHVFNDARYPELTPEYVWSSANEQINALITGQNQKSVKFDAGLLDEGYYFVDVSVSFTGPNQPIHTSTLRQFFKVSAQASLIDYDQDHLVNEAIDTHENNANLGYLHNLNAGSLRYLKARSVIEIDGLSQSDVAIKLRAGQINQDQQISSIDLQHGDMYELSLGAQGQLNKTEFIVFDELIDNYYDLEVINLPFVGASAQIVIPLKQPIEAGAGIWIKPGDPTENQAFINLPLENIKSANVQGDTCPAPSSNEYVAGLNQSSQCVLITLVDGGVLEAETNNSKNGMIKALIAVDSGVVIPPAPPAMYIANTAIRGFGQVNVWFLISCLCLLLLFLSPRLSNKENSHD
ncbi:MAG: hypothetical protein HRU38_06475, partial [Saccharospirillaceae bacterium]|nr:MSCRAMM family adhesin SdrC [Pseudomonadales bacterium]NRB78299.1 hypothetical protein [Saccharospirillaceae bacterium]